MEEGGGDFLLLMWVAGNGFSAVGGLLWDKVFSFFIAYFCLSLYISISANIFMLFTAYIYFVYTICKKYIIYIQNM